MRIVIVGAGLAGAATAYWGARRGWQVQVCEREAVPGVHASGRSAAMLRRVEADPVVRALAFDGAAFLAVPPSGWPGPPLLRSTGGVLLAGSDELSALREAAAASTAAGAPVAEQSADELRARWPALEGAPPLGGLYCAADGVIDVHGLLQGLLAGARSAGATIHWNCHVERLLLDEGRVVGAATAGGDLPADVVVDAAGAWAGGLAAAAGLPAPPLQPLRRHLMHLRVVPWMVDGWPWIWDVTHGLYFRPESGGLLASACDEQPVPPGPSLADPEAPAWLAAKVQEAAPALAEATVASGWAGLRTFAPDRRPVIGWDPRVAGLFWVAGLGGFGVTCAAAIGRLAADVIGGDVSGLPAEVRPERFA